jgi:hypothetical protein
MLTLLGPPILRFLIDQAGRLEDWSGDFREYLVAWDRMLFANADDVAWDRMLFANADEWVSYMRRRV